MQEVTDIGKDFDSGVSGLNKEQSSVVSNPSGNNLPEHGPLQPLVTPHNGTPPNTSGIQETHGISLTPPSYDDGLPKLEPAVDFGSYDVVTTSNLPNHHTNPPVQPIDDCSDQATNSQSVAYFPQSAVPNQSGGASNMSTPFIPFSSLVSPNTSEPPSEVVPEPASTDNVSFFVGSSRNVMVFKNEQPVFEERGSDETRERSALSKENQSLKQQLSNAQRSINVLEDKLQKVEKEKMEKELEQKEKDKQHQEIVAQKDQAILLLRKNLEKEKEMVAKYKERISQEERERQDVRKKHDAEIEKLEQQLKEKEQCFDKEVQKLTAEKHKVDLECKDLQIREQKLIAQLKDAQTQVAELKLQISESEKEELKQQIKVHRSESEDMEKQKKQVEQEFAVYRSDSQVEIDKLKKQVGNLESKNEEASNGEEVEDSSSK